MSASNDGLMVKEVYYDPEEVLFNEGDPPTGMFIIEDGEVEVYRQDGPRRTSVAKLGRGDVIGELSMVEGVPHSRSVRALTHVDALIVEPEQLEEALRQSPPLVRMVLRRVVRKLHRTNDLAFGPSKAKVQPLPRQSESEPA